MTTRNLFYDTDNYFYTERNRILTFGRVKLQNGKTASEVKVVIKSPTSINSQRGPREMEYFRNEAN